MTSAWSPVKMGAETYKMGLADITSPLSFRFAQWEVRAKEILHANAWEYVYGSAGRREGDEANTEAFKKWAVVPRRLIPVSQANLSTTVLGKRYEYPIAIAPVGVQTLFHRDGELATCTAAKTLGVPYTCSSASSTAMEKIAEKQGSTAPRFFQLYWPPNSQNELTKSLLSRAKKAGYSALIVTLDSFTVGWRPDDLEHGYNPFFRPDHIGIELGLTDPVFRKECKDEFGGEPEDNLAQVGIKYISTISSGTSHSWQDLQFLKEHWDGPIILKGIQTVEDAQKAVEHGMDGVIVSTHGGREIDGCVGSLEMLPAIANAVGHQIEVYFDSGIRSGVDVAKALALGARMVFIGRLFVYGLAIGGEKGVEHVLKSIIAELEVTLRLLGIASIQPEDLSVNNMVYRGK